MPSKQPKLSQIKITNFDKNGHGIGKISENELAKQVEVPFSIPGDEIFVEIKKQKKSSRGMPLEWTHLSAERIIPRCSHFGSCGGCQWQQITYEQQLQLKEEKIKHLFAPYLNDQVKWHPIIACTPPWQYRNKMEFTFSSDKAGNKYLGLILFGTRGHVFDLQECHLCNPWMPETVKAVKKWWEHSGLEAYRTGWDTGALRNLTLREGMNTGDRLVMLTVSGNLDYAIQKHHLNTFVDAIKSSVEPKENGSKLSIFLRIQQIAKGKPTQFYEMVLYGQDHYREILSVGSSEQDKKAIQFNISPTAFFQPNTRQAEKLYTRAIEMTELAHDSIIYDLYCGTATLGICMSFNAKEVIGIELSPESVCDARDNIKRNGLTNITIHQGDVGKILPSLLEDTSKKPDAVFVDPPRAGLEEKALRQILELASPKLTYISCNPVTQAANLEALIKGGYRLQAVQPVEQFPQTVHVENILTLNLS